MLKDNDYNNSKDYINRWIISYADLVTLLLALFLVMFAVNNNENCSKVNAEGVNKNQGVNSTRIVVEIKKDKPVKMPELQKELLTEFKNDDNVILLKDTRGLIIRLNDNVLFGSAETELQPEAIQTLNKIIDILSKINNPVIIEGHTDSLPIKSKKFASNWELSTARATSVIDYLVQSKRVNPRRLSAVGYGEFVPVADNTSNSGRMKNRRVDIIILDNSTGD